MDDYLEHRYLKKAEQYLRTGVTPPPRLLYSQTELRELRKLQAIARVERHELGTGP